jgi:uncharacterized small protein (DUF1192 family)
MGQHRPVNPECLIMSFDDLPQHKPPAIAVGENLDLLSVAELEQRIEALEGEIARAKAAIASKKASKSAADAFFRN